MRPSNLEKQAFAQAPGTTAPRPWRWKLGLSVLALASISIAVMFAPLRRERLQYRLLVALPDAAAADPSLVRFAV
ncbi:MAG: hypothetical protein ACRETD_12205, partial [Steroidobacteraceae bacterium]